MHLQFQRIGYESGYPLGRPARTVWKPQLREHHCWLGFVKPAVPTRWGQEDSAGSLTMIYSNTPITNCKAAVHSTWITVYGLRLEQPHMKIHHVQ